MNNKLQEMVLMNEKLRDECLKKIVAYKDKYTQYKEKVKQANSKIAILTQTVARYEI